MDLRQVLARNLRQARHEKGLSQEELADLAEINRTYISKLETGSTWGGLEIIARLARVLGCSAADLVMEEKQRKRQR
jgi:transcriptional regulator with XRE-family HTH domain